MTQDATMKVYSVNDFYWYMAPTPAEAITKAMEDAKLQGEECDFDEPAELTSTELEDLTFHADDDDITFAEELRRRVAAGPKTEMFATTEF
jgi:hypothetical protein